jgi:xanthine dehydrogenase YagR molybdenum-binding subunit
MAYSWPKERRIIGKKTPRIDGPDKSTGHAKYSFDINRPGMLHAKILRSPHAHCKVTSIDASAAESMGGVKAVHIISGPGTELYYAGDEIVALAADTEEHLADGLRAIKVEYEQLPFLVMEEDALKKDQATVSPVAKERKNIRVSAVQEKGNVDAGLKEADAVHEGVYGLSTICHQCLESHGMVAEWDADGNLTVWCSTQATYGTAQGLAVHFKVPITKVRCITHHMGGGYGSKFSADIQGIVCAELARKAKAPVKLMLDRAEEAVAGGVRPSASATVKIAGTKDGKITAYLAESHGSPGRGNSNTVGPMPYVYPLANSRHQHTVVRLNAQDARAMRAPGHPQSCFLTDCPVDDLAAKLGINPLQVRLKNLPENDPAAVKNAPQSWNALRNTIYNDELRIAAELSEWEKKWHLPRP